MSASKIYFVRHGQSRANAEDTVAGSSDSPLTDKGIAQANQEGRMLADKGLKFDLIVSSHLSRAYDTALTIARYVDYDESDVLVTDLFAERGLGRFEGGPRKEFREATEEERVRGGTESLEDLFKRVQRANEFISARAHGSVLIVAHGGFYRMARCVAEGRSPEDTYTLEDPENSRLLDYPL